MECGHSSICFECTMTIAIKNRNSNKPPFCHFCRKIIKFALKIEDHNQPIVTIKEFPNEKQNTKIQFKKPINDEKERLVRIVSYVDFSEDSLMLGPANRRNRRRNLPKFKEV